jgi:DNA-binding response OmpR family regulator
LAHEENIRYAFHCNSTESWVSYDADKLEKIVANLLSNAFKYTPENESVELKAEISSDNNLLKIWVTDSGPGIPEDMQENIFDRFFRLRGEKLNRIPGSGIGLSLVKELIRLLQGTIEVISDGISGSSFYVVLPLQPANKVIKEKDVHDYSVDIKNVDSDEKYTVLIIEDEEPMLRFITHELETHFQVKGVNSVEKAFEWLNREIADLIISDVMLPGMSGLEFCRRIKSEITTSHLPVILLTARDSESEIVEGLNTGADDYITKPFQMNQLIARCFNLIENRKRFKDRFADEEQLQGISFTVNQNDREYLDKAFRIVYENLDNPEFDVPGFCLLMSSSKTLLYSKLKSLTGLSATEFVRNIRLKESKKLLQIKGQHLTIAEISYKVGFNDPLYFSRCFRKYFGVPPSDVSKGRTLGKGGASVIIQEE